MQNSHILVLFFIHFQPTVNINITAKLKHWQTLCNVNWSYGAKEMYWINIYRLKKKTIFFIPFIVRQKNLLVVLMFNKYMYLIMAIKVFIYILHCYLHTCAQSCLYIRLFWINCSQVYKKKHLTYNSTIIFILWFSDCWDVEPNSNILCWYIKILRYINLIAENVVHIGNSQLFSMFCPSWSNSHFGQLPLDKYIQYS